MMCIDRDALICDLAEVYHVYDIKSLPLRTVATLAAGLGYNSRIMRKLSGQSYSVETLLTAAMLDKLAFLVYMHTEDAHNGKNPPKSILSTLIGENDEDGTEIETFTSAEAFETARAELLSEIKDG